MHLSRRTFVVVGASALGGLALGFRCDDADQHTGESGRGGAASFAPNPFLRIEPDGRIIVVAPRPEMGQGVRTSLAMLVAEELDAPWERVTVEQADLDEDRYGPQYTGGSAVIRTAWEPLRRAGATARAMLVTAAARRWGVAPGECETEAGQVVHRATSRRLEYGELARAARALPAPTDVSLKDPSQYKLIGRPVRGVDTPAIVRGAPMFGLDVSVPGMLVAAIERSPVFGGRVVHVDDSAARRIAGTRQVLQIDADALPAFDPNSPRPANGVAVLGDNTWAAFRGRDALIVQWDHRGGDTESTAALRLEASRVARQPPRQIARAEGDVDSALREAARRLEADYTLPFLAHAPMEPMNCTAHVRESDCEIWAPTQNPQDARIVAARITGLPPAAVTVHPVRMGGAFGRRFYSDFVAEAVVLSRAAKRPVQVVWSREDDMRHGFYRPAAHHFMQAGLDRDNRLVAWSQHLVNASRGSYLSWQIPEGRTELDPGELEPFDLPAGFVPNVRIGYTAQRSRIPRGQWRAVESSATVFVTQGFLDEVAHAAGQDPVAFQLAMLEPAREIKYYDGRYDTGRLAGVIRLAAQRSQWNRRRELPPGQGRGFAASYANSAYVAHVADVHVGPGGDVRVTRVVTAVDCGRVVNPLGARAQVEGAVGFGLSAALFQEITVAGGRVQEGNFQDYRVLRMGEAPAHEIHFVESSAPVRGLGECALPAIAPAVANAIFAATSRRIRDLPIARHRDTRVGRP